MVVTKDMPMPSDAELTVPQEITLSTPYFKAVVAYMGVECENEMKEFMLKRSEHEDPRKTLSEGAKLTECGVKFLRALKKTCYDDVARYADCIDNSHKRLYVTPCREEQRFLDRCVEDKMSIKRPPVGYFSKVHVHSTSLPKPELKVRDYKAEAALVLKELPEDYQLKKEYKRFRDHRFNFFET
ncbi:NADH-ubiquinone oxidoreductase subunit [Aphelenchoides avenae]|nr:NADH-ubiquinone oxidoreductase subunit [Aphelenchus avenae]